MRCAVTFRSYLIYLFLFGVCFEALNVKRLNMENNNRNDDNAFYGIIYAHKVNDAKVRVVKKFYSIFNI